jgi:uncharacterized membrane protein YeaQ/YmgE (transglycosylase-associated protein family)
MLSNIIFWVIFGLIAGSIAFFIDPDKESGGFIQSIFVGILGSVVGGFIANFFGFPQVNGFNCKKLQRCI